MPDRWRLDAVVDSPDLRRDELPWLAGRPDYSRLYFGVEFCQHLLPPSADVVRAVELAKERGWDFTLLTPYATDSFVDAIEERAAAALEAGAEDLEVVVNDWGVLHRLKTRFAEAIRPVLGRGLNRMIRDPRLPDVGPEHLGGDAPPASWQQASHDSTPFRSLMTRLGVHRIETDVPLQGLSPSKGADGTRLAVHLPYGMTASGRVCMVNAWGKPSSLRFVPPRHCDAPCRDFTIELRAPWARREGGADALPLVSAGEILPLTHVLNRRRNKFPIAERDPAPRFLQKGNTHFYRLEGESLERALAWVEAQEAVDRLVVEPDIPM